MKKTQRFRAIFSMVSLCKKCGGRIYVYICIKYLWKDHRSLLMAISGKGDGGAEMRGRLH